VIRFGSDAGCLQAEALDREGRRLASASLLSRGQRMAILPAAFGVEALLSGELASRGVVGPAWLAPEEAITRIRKRGLEFAFDGESQKPPAADRTFSD
jgi:hypothetical protein